MANLNVEFNFSGFKELEKLMQKSAKVEQEVRRVVKSNGNELKNRMVRKADFRGHMEGKKFVPPTGDTKRSIGETIAADGLSVTVGATTEYSPYLEYGTRFMQPQSFVRPAWTEQVPKFVRDLNKIIEENT